MQRRRLLVAAGAVFSIALMSLSNDANAAACDEASARARLATLKTALQRPESLAAIDAAKADFAVDQKFDNEHNAKVLAAAAVYFKAERHLDAGAVGDACLFLGQADALINEVVAGK
jgi:hypothetical protein